MKHTKVTLGIDEAGRGPVLGQMVLAAVALDTKAARKLTRAGLRDSKSYGAGKKARLIRQNLADEVREHALHVRVRVVDVAEIDRRVRRSELNLLEREVADAMIASVPPVDRIVADGARLFSQLQSKHKHLEAYDNGEARHASVAAASVIAKTRRDELFARIQQRYAPQFGGFGGGGYVNNATREFLRSYAKTHNCLPPEARRSWPYVYLQDILGADFDSFADCQEEQFGQVELFPAKTKN